MRYLWACTRYYDESRAIEHGSRVSFTNFPYTRWVFNSSLHVIGHKSRWLADAYNLMNAFFFRHYFTTLAPIVITVMYIERTKMCGNSWPKQSMRRRGLSARLKNSFRSVWSCHLSFFYRLVIPSPRSFVTIHGRMSKRSGRVRRTIDFRTNFTARAREFNVQRWIFTIFYRPVKP